LKEAAKLTSKRLWEAQEIQEKGPFEIFQPLFKIRKNLGKDLPSGFVCNHLERYDKYDFASKKNSRALLKEEILKVIEIALSTSVRAAASEILKPEEYESKSGINELIEVTRKMITEDIMGGMDPEKYMAGIQHENCDVTYYVPFCKYLGTGCLIVSFKWG